MAGAVVKRPAYGGPAAEQIAVDLRHAHDAVCLPLKDAHEIPERAPPSHTRVRERPDDHDSQDRHNAQDDEQAEQATDHQYACPIDRCSVNRLRMPPTPPPLPTGENLLVMSSGSTSRLPLRMISVT